LLRVVAMPLSRPLSETEIGHYEGAQSAHGASIRLGRKPIYGIIKT